MEKRHKQGQLKRDAAYERLLEMILNGNIEERFPTEPVLSGQLGISRVTLRAALDRLAKAGLISRSHYYGTRVVAGEKNRTVLVVHGDNTSSGSTDHITKVANMFEAHLKEKGYGVEYTSYHFLQSVDRISEKYCGVLFFGAGFRGNEPFLHVLKECPMPVILNREDHDNKLSGIFNSVGADTKAAWLQGYDYLLGLGYRSIATLCSNDERNKQRMGLTSLDMARELKNRGADKAAELIFLIDPRECEENMIRILRDCKPEALYCYSGVVAAQAYRTAKERSLSIPDDIAILSFGEGSNLLTPSLSSVDLNYTICGIAEAELMLRLQNKKDAKPIDLTIPFYINAKGSTHNYIL
ncbi:MAG: GntR family transcriptional regulator [Victivallales bacterium]|nr:GntR family transcriptional regulator [Victivallales bacterium]